MVKVAIAADYPLAHLVAGEVVSDGGVGGGASWLPQLAAAFGGLEGADIYWLVPWHKGEETQRIEKWGQCFHLVRAPGRSACMLLGRRPLVRSFRKVLNRIQPDLLHVWGSENLCGAALEGFDGPSVFSLQGILHRLRRTGYLPGWRWRLFEHWEQQSLRLASRITCESQWGCDQIRPLIGDKPMDQIEYGVDPLFYGTPWSPERADPNVVFVGSLGPLKGVDILCEMLRRHPRRRWRITFVGDGSLAGELCGLNDSGVEVTGQIDRREVLERVASAWCLVHPSRADTSPNAVKEARVIGLPVIGSPHGGHAEYISSGNDGVLIDSEDPNRWFKAIDSLCADFDQCRALGAERHAYFREHFRPKKTAEAFVNLYQEMLGV